jgi:AhpD family alkylhydroperoxidase
MRIAYPGTRRIAKGIGKERSFHRSERLFVETQTKETSMKKLLVLFALISISGTAVADNKSAQTLKQIEGALGFVPQFVRQIPASMLPSWWDGMTAVQLNPNSKLDGKTKELIGLAVSAQIPCEYCIYFHTEAARLNGATDLEIQEAIGMAANTRFQSTLLNGLQVDKGTFKKDVERIVRGAKQAKK